MKLLGLDQSLPQRVVIVLEDQILNGKYEPGDRLYEMEISKDLQISRAPIREAFHILERKGLLDIIPRRGTYVSKITDSGINNLLDLRRALDGLAAHFAAKRHKPEQLKKMMKLIRSQEQAAKKADKSKFQNLGQKFYMSICEATENPKLISILQDLSTEGLLYRITDMAFTGSISESIEEHKKIFDAIRFGNDELAQKLAENHIDSLRIRLLSKAEKRKAVQKNKD